MINEVVFCNYFILAGETVEIVQICSQFLSDRICSSMKYLLGLIVAGCCIYTSLSLSSALGPYKISDVTVSGISSGGYMAVQLHIAHSSVVNGSAVFAGVRRIFYSYFLMQF